MKIPWQKSRKQLALLWFVGSGIIFITLLIQSFGNVYGDSTQEAWIWVLPHIMPTLSLILGVLVADAFTSEQKLISVDKFLFTLSFYISLFYLLTVVSTILIEPVSESTSMELMEMSNFWLPPFQGLVSASLGAFFVQAEKQTE